MQSDLMEAMPHAPGKITLSPLLDFHVLKLHMQSASILVFQIS